MQQYYSLIYYSIIYHRIIYYRIINYSIIYCAIIAQPYGVFTRRSAVGGPRYDVANRSIYIYIAMTRVSYADIFTVFIYLFIYATQFEHRKKMREDKV